MSRFDPEWKKSLYVNQRDISGWEKNGCGIACITMVVRHGAARVSDVFLDSPEDLIDLCPKPEKIGEQMRSINGHIEGVGCKHASIARLLGNWGIPAYPREFTYPDKDTEKDFKDLGIREIDRFCRKGGVVIASMRQPYDPDQPSRLILVTGTGVRRDHWEDQTNRIGQTRTFVMSDPGSPPLSSGHNVMVSKECFVGDWRGYAVFVDISQETLLHFESIVFRDIVFRNGKSSRNNKGKLFIKALQNAGAEYRV